MLFALVIGACTTPSAQETVADVRNHVEARTGFSVEDVSRDAPEKTSPSDDLVLSSDQAIRLALANNQSLRANFATLEIARADLIQAGLLPNPIFDAAFRFPDDGGAVNLDLGLAFELLDGLALPIRRKVAKSDLEIAKLQTAALIVDVAIDTKRKYYDILAAERLDTILSTAREAAKASYTAATKLHEAGNLPQLQVDGEHVLYLEADVRAQEAALDLQMKRQNLSTLLGLPENKPSWKTDGNVPPSSNAIADDLESVALSNSFALAIGRRTKTSFQHGRPLSDMRALFTDVSGGATAERDDGEWEVGPSVEIGLPLFDHGQANRLKNHATVDFYDARERHQQTLVRNAVKMAQAQLTLSKYKVDTYRSKILPLQEKLLNGARAELNAMQIGLFEILGVKRAQLNAVTELVKAESDYWRALIDIEYLKAGGLPDASKSVVAAARSQSAGDRNGAHP